MTLDGIASAEVTDAFDVEALNGALDELRELDEDFYRVVELRVFSSMTVEEIALVLPVLFDQ